MLNLESLLLKLSNARGPSGFESEVRQIVRKELDPYVNSLETDGVGSLIGLKNGPPNSPKVMLSAHMDEVGLLVRYVTSDGFIKFQNLGGWLDQALIGQRWQIITSTGIVLGVTGIKTPHVMSTDERSKIFKGESLFIDVGAKDKLDAEDRLGIKPGDPISPYSQAEKLNDSDFILGKAWDDRAGLAVMIGVMDSIKNQDLPFSLYAVATVQEEVGLRGAHTSSYAVNPDIGLNLESGVAGDYPGISQYEAQEKLGAGPAIFLHDSSMLPNLNLRDFVIETAKEIDIPLQFNVLSGYGQDGAEMQKSFEGVPVINITVPTRYLHSHNSLINLKDVEAAIKLVEACILKLHPTVVEDLKSFD
ncbi:MAG: M42 family metallopeptidase [Dehalococcoidia bacterium]|mgnify:CR=1 FL=1|tara:strand:- start:573 stop:1655 length:1083 start_codon:yes stop_codon:yes gene_type:complete